MHAGLSAAVVLAAGAAHVAAAATPQTATAAPKPTKTPSVITHGDQVMTAVPWSQANVNIQMEGGPMYDTVYTASDGKVVFIQGFQGRSPDGLPEYRSDKLDDDEYAKYNDDVYAEYYPADYQPKPTPKPKSADNDVFPKHISGPHEYRVIDGVKYIVIDNAEMPFRTEGPPATDTMFVHPRDGIHMIVRGTGGHGYLDPALDDESGWEDVIPPKDN